jgi:hypothetical protein
MDPTIAFPAAGVANWLRLNLMPPRIDFGSPVQRAKSELESFWHVPIKLHPRWWIGTSSLVNCRAYLDVYEGGHCKERIRLCWGDQTYKEREDYEHLRRGHVSLAPVAWRTELGEDRNGYFADARLVKSDQQERVHPISNTRVKYRFRLRIKSETFWAESPHFYQVRCPPISSNGHFIVEIEYEGEGTQP